MLEDNEEFRKVIYTVCELLKADSEDELLEIINSSEIHFEESGYDNWNGGIILFTININVDVSTFVTLREYIEKIEADLLSRFEFATRHNNDEVITSVRIIPKSQPKICWNKMSGITTKEEIISDIDFIRSTMVSVSTGGQRIQEVNDEYRSRYNTLNIALQKLSIQNPNPYKDLWEWYGKWSADFPHYRERRAFVSEIYNNLIETLNESPDSNKTNVTINLTGWERIARTINEIKSRQNEAKEEEQFQAIGLLCREVIITLSQAVFAKEKHPILDNTAASKTDAKRMIEAYIAVELSGSSNERARKFAKNTLELANELTHKRTATKKDAILCSIATLALINFIGTIEGRI